MEGNLEEFNYRLVSSYVFSRCISPAPPTSHLPPPSSLLPRVKVRISCSVATLTFLTSDLSESEDW